MTQTFSLSFNRRINIGTVQGNMGLETGQISTTAVNTSTKHYAISNLDVYGSCDTWGNVHEGSSSWNVN